MTTISARIDDHEERLTHVEQVLITGQSGGAVPVREQVRNHDTWITENKKPISDAIIEVAAHGRWISNFNRVAWIAVTVLIGIFIEFGCAASIGVVILLNQFGILPKP
jgi:hypothetical protein